LGATGGFADDFVNYGEFEKVRGRKMQLFGCFRGFLAIFPKNGATLGVITNSR